ncbi:MAG: glycerol-3-phosphate responsive antiterminator [Clostridiales bacterium]|nr:glycerol-3-phosphate responsive antiterminator [Clostridiales bacterium]
MKEKMIESLLEYPIITAIKDEIDLAKCLTSDSKVVFILYGDICNIGNIIKTVKSAGKIAIVHIDLIAGLSNSEVSVEYMVANTDLDGIISTKFNLIKAAKDRGLITIQRIFMIDSLALKNINRHLNRDEIDFIEVLPGVMPKIIKKITNTTNIPIIAGGLVSDNEDAIAALNAGAIAISTSAEGLWS